MGTTVTNSLGEKWNTLQIQWIPLIWYMTYWLRKTYNRYIWCQKNLFCIQLNLKWHLLARDPKKTCKTILRGINGVWSQSSEWPGKKSTGLQPAPWTIFSASSLIFILKLRKNSIINFHKFFSWYTRTKPSLCKQKHSYDHNRVVLPTVAHKWKEDWLE